MSATDSKYHAIVHMLDKGVSEQMALRIADDLYDPSRTDRESLRAASVLMLSSLADEHERREAEAQDVRKALDAMFHIGLGFGLSFERAYAIKEGRPDPGEPDRGEALPSVVFESEAF